jgi:CheY-like chemotaxis protein
MQVLVCDDDAATRFVVRLLLARTFACTVAECGDGVEALRLIDGGKVDLLVLDIEMPVMDGVEVLEAIRQSSKFNHLSVMMLSRERHDDVVLRLVKLGICGYVLKPLRHETFIAALKAIEPTVRLRARGPVASSDSSAAQLNPHSPALLVD